MFSETLTWNRTASSALPRGYHSMNLMMLMEKMKIYLVNIVDKCACDNDKSLTFYQTFRYKVSALNIAETVTTLVDQGSMSL